MSRRPHLPAYSSTTITLLKYLSSPSRFFPRQTAPEPPSLQLTLLKLAYTLSTEATDDFSLSELCLLHPLVAHFTLYVCTIHHPSIHSFIHCVQSHLTLPTYYLLPITYLPVALSSFTHDPGLCRE